MLGFHSLSLSSFSSFKKEKINTKPFKVHNIRKNFFSNLNAQYNYNIFLNGNDRAKRGVTNEDRYAIIQKPLGIILEEGSDGMVFIAKIDPNGNAAKSNFDIRIGDIVTAVSATFGDEVWSTRGVGLDRVLKSIKIRAGDFVTLVLESSEENEDQKNQAQENASQRRTDAREKFGEPVILDPITLTPVNSSEPEEKKEGFFNFFK
ncbi:hypothetical protein HAN_1g57 (nucleomorph) [Hemiselmis andersenii]|uniref:PDZ domain-containing protein n=1 Tax=Hemiselmis andersenii TaxID=464988 RepID=A9BK69_HEMAN|nr:hypothetical protein HAN_1g57 [Hemiselmis andersenii]ABW97902.1 hypothetical protein HAN_1g57 [Hemiselmis andersenii]|mmetsp:Transcript_503/g.1190  ORF Transcript_503/g.1190 Transcript_503/m.1190 type:complete len:205 (-) Transcript_503:190-804(-)